MSQQPQAESEGFWAQLRQRKVARWGIAYAAGAWGAMQGLEYFSHTFDWPRQIQQIATLALVIGLFVVVVLAWYHGDRGQQHVTATELTILTLLFLLAGGIFWRYERQTPAASVVAPAVTNAAASAIDQRSIAVLPFVDMSQGHDQEYFSDGISEELLNLLSQVPQLRVIARTSSFSFKGKSADAAQIAHALQVAHLLEGSVRKSGDTLRITVQLVRASDSSHLWSQTYDRRLTDVFKVQDEIAAAVVSELKIKLLGAAPRSREVDPGAYTLYLEALEIGRKGSADALEQSNRLYQQALAIDANYAAAWEGLAGNYCEQVMAWQLPPEEGFRLAREATAKALQLDPEFAPAHARLGWLALYDDRDLGAAAGHLERALTMAPKDPGIIEGAGNLVRRLGRLDHALALNRYLVSRDPLNPTAHDSLSATYMDAGRWDDSIAEMRTVLALSPSYVAMHALIGEMLLQKGDARGALAEMEKEPDENSRLVGLVMAYAALGRKAESDTALAALIRKYEQTSAYNIAFVLAFRRENDRAFEWLDKAVRHHDPSVVSIAGYPMFGRLESDPRWLPFLHSIGVAPEQLAAVKFDVKIPQ